MGNCVSSSPLEDLVARDRARSPVFSPDVRDDCSTLNSPREDPSSPVRASGDGGTSVAVLSPVVLSPSRQERMIEGEVLRPRPQSEEQSWARSVGASGAQWHEGVVVARPKSSGDEDAPAESLTADESATSASEAEMPSEIAAIEAIGRSPRASPPAGGSTNDMPGLKDSGPIDILTIKGGTSPERALGAEVPAMSSRPALVPEKEGDQVAADNEAVQRRRLRLHPHICAACLVYVGWLTFWAKAMPSLRAHGLALYDALSLAGLAEDKIDEMVINDILFEGHALPPAGNEVSQQANGLEEIYEMPVADVPFEGSAPPRAGGKLLPHWPFLRHGEEAEETLSLVGPAKDEIDEMVINEMTFKSRTLSHVGDSEDDIDTMLTNEVNFEGGALSCAGNKVPRHWPAWGSDDEADERDSESQCRENSAHAAGTVPAGRARQRGNVGAGRALFEVVSRAFNVIRDEVVI